MSSVSRNAIVIYLFLVSAGLCTGFLSLPAWRASPLSDIGSDLTINCSLEMRKYSVSSCLCS